MLKHHHEGIVAHSPQCLANIGKGRRRLASSILLARHNERVCSTPDYTVLVAQDIPSCPLLTRYSLCNICLSHSRRHMGVNAIVVIAQHGIYSIGSLNLCKDVLHGIYLLRLHVLDISCEHHHVGMLRINAVYIPLQQLAAVVLECTDMGIREMDDAVAVELLRKIVEVEVKMPDLQFPEAEDKAIAYYVYLEKGYGQPQYVTPIGAPVAKAAQQIPCRREQGENGLGHNDNAYKHHVDIDEHHLVGHEITRRGNSHAVGKHQQTWQPPQ